MQDYKKLVVWQEAHQLALAVYRMTGSFPEEERYGLTNQMRRAAVSIPSNIAEGCGRDGNAEFCRFLFIAMGSANEVEYQLLLAHDLAYLAPDGYSELDQKLGAFKRMLNVLIQKVKPASDHQGRP